uniref:Reelin domain-containing protein n=1 Tax=Caenorhabditis tropicalis TaxID=1561998 RepID=A0A1I7UZC9_9PELO
MFPLLLVVLFCLTAPVLTEPYNSTTDDVTLLLASEETPTRSPRPVTKQRKMVESATPSEDPLWVTDCSEPLNKDISCSVNIVGCSDNVFGYVEPGAEPPRAHDVRIASTIKVMGANRIDKRKHRLHVDVSWQVPHLDTSRALKAFKLYVNGPDGRNTCFVFNVTQQHTPNEEDNVSPRYRFSSNTLFEFGASYTVTIVSLPISRKRAPKVSSTSQMPDDPDQAPTKLIKTPEEICTGKSNPQASKWAASYRKIFLFSAIRMIQIEFLAAPPQYCFEEYEIRLLDSSGIVMLQSAIIPKSDLRTEFINGRNVQFGEYNFTDIELDTLLIPSVIPIETAHDGRCLCETENGCSCLAADWKPVKLATNLNLVSFSIALFIR